MIINVIRRFDSKPPGHFERYGDLSTVARSITMNGADGGIQSL
jgi:hypothetical protein